jgi:Fe-S-cluster-containing dehydrogenase component
MKKNKRYAIVLDTGKCIDCKACTVACKAENDVPLGRNNYRNWVDDGELRGTYPTLGQSFTPSQCQHCGNPPCAHVCPTKATEVSEDGIVHVVAKKCIGCKYCQTASYGFRGARGALGPCATAQEKESAMFLSASESNSMSSPN